MSKRLDVLSALHTLISSALPGADVLGIENDDVAPTRPTPGGRVVIRSGDPGDPEMTLGVLSYSYSHRIPIEITAYPSSSQSREQIVDAMAGTIGTAIIADRTLGGLCEWVEAEAPQTDDIRVAGTQAARAADLAVIAEYTTSDPLN